MKESSILSAKSCFDISELEDNWRNCSECKKPLEIREVAKTLPSNLWKAPRPYYPVLTYAVTSKTTLNNLVPRAFSLKNGWGGKRPWHRLVSCPLVHPKILGVIN